MTGHLIHSLEKLAAPFRLPAELEERVISQAVVRVYTENDFIIRSGQLCRSVYFITGGLARSYYKEDGKEFTSGLLQEGFIESSWISCFDNKPYGENIAVLEECVAIYLDHKTIGSLYNDFPVFNFIGRRQAELSFLEAKKRTEVLRSLSAEERYKWFCKKYPSLLAKVPLKHIASYLGMTDVTLSRLRAKFKKVQRGIS